MAEPLTGAADSRMLEQAAIIRQRGTGLDALAGKRVQKGKDRREFAL